MIFICRFSNASYFSNHFNISLLFNIISVFHCSDLLSFTFLNSVQSTKMLIIRLMPFGSMYKSVVLLFYHALSLSASIHLLDIFAEYYVIVRRHTQGSL